MYYICGMCLRTSRYMPLYIRVWYVLWVWYVPTYEPIYILMKGILYVLYLRYVSTYETIFTSLHTCLVCFMSVVCAYIRIDICLFKYVFGTFHGCGMCLHTSRNMPLYIHLWCVLRLWYVSSYLEINAFVHTCWYALWL